MTWQKLEVNFLNLRLLQEHIPSIHKITARSTYTLDGYDIMVFNQNLYGEYEGDFYLQNQNVVLYSAPW
jgi:hypothetical protein